MGYQTIPALAIVTVAIAAMGFLPGKIYSLANGGKQKPVSQDEFSHLLRERDQRPQTNHA
jgi:hypothetical protein